MFTFHNYFLLCPAQRILNANVYHGSHCLYCVCVCKYARFVLTGEMGEIIRTKCKLVETRLSVCLCVCLQIMLLKQKLKEYEERKMEAPALNPISSQRRAEFEK